MSTDPHEDAIAELRQLFDASPRSSSARAAVRALQAQKPFELFVACVEPSTAIWTGNTCTAAKLIAEPSHLLLKIMAVARAAEWEKIIVAVQDIIPLPEPTP